MAKSNKSVAAGQDAVSPGEIPRRGWRDILTRVMNAIVSDHVSVVSAGVAFFGLLAIFPAITAIIAIAGYVLDPADIAAELERVLTLIPENAASIIESQVREVTGGNETATGLAALFGLALALYGAMKGMLTLMEGMNIAYNEQEKRGFVTLYATALILTLASIVGLIVTVGIAVVLPAVVAFIGLPEGTQRLVELLPWPLLAVLTIIALAVLYRFGPSRSEAKWRWVLPGAVVAMIFWLLGTVAFSYYARSFGSYSETYGTLGGIIVLLTWLWLTSFVVLAGAELNSEMEHQTRRDSTTGAPQPEGARGAVKADTRPTGPGGPERYRTEPEENDAPQERSTRRKRNLVDIGAGALALLALSALRRNGRRDTLRLEDGAAVRRVR